MNCQALTVTRSLKRKLLWPLLLFAAAISVITIWSIYTNFETQLTESLRLRGERIANTVSYAAESVSRPGELQRIVTSLGAEEGVNLIVVIGGNPSRVLASTRIAWLGRELTKLPDDVTEYLADAIHSRQGSQGYHAATSEYDVTSPLLLGQTELAGQSLSGGAVVVHLDAREAKLAMRLLSIQFSIGGLVAIGLLAVLGYLYIHRLILRPVSRIGKLVERFPDVAGEDWAEVSTDDELGVLARNLKDSLTQTDTALRELEQQTKALSESELRFRQLNEELEARVKKRTVQLEASNTELEQFAYIASHDLQEPLRMVVGYVQLLEKRLAGKLDAEAIEFMGYAVDGALRMQTLIQDILAYSRVTTRGQPLTPANSALALREALDRLASRVNETGAEVDAQPLPMVMADYSQLVQLFQNLIGNAIKFCKEHPPRVRVAATHEAGWWRFTVTDNGIGIAPEYRDQLFVIFKRLHTRREYPGTGIGLAICKRIMERHGGTIGIESASGGGTVFWFTLPEEKCT